MRIIFKIAGAELKTLFYAPIAWLTIVVFYIISGIRFLTTLAEYSRSQEIFVKHSAKGMEFGSEAPLTFVMVNGSLTNILYYIFLFVPLITMSVINREEQAGTMKLLGSSPVRNREIVLGKYLGLIGFNCVLMGSVGLIFLTAWFSIENAELYWYGYMLFGLTLYSSCLMAIGLFVSSITSHQVVAAITTFLVLSFLRMMGNVGQEYDFIRDITWFLSPAGRTENMVQGLITTRDVCYFLLIIFLFLGLTIIRLKSRQESVSWSVKLLRNVLFTMFILTLGYLTSRPGYIGYLDVTRDNRNSIDSASQAVLKELDGSPVTVTLYTNLLGDKAEVGFPRTRNTYIWKFWDRYVRFYPNIKWKYVYYYDVKKGDNSIFRRYPKKDIHYVARQTARLNNVELKDFMKPGEVDKLVDLSGEQSLRLVMELEYNGKKTFTRFSAGNSPWPKESVMSASFRRLVKDATPQFYFTTGHYERSPWRMGEREYGAHVNHQLSDGSMVNNGMDADTLSLLYRDIPAKTDVMVVADPRSQLEDIEQQKIVRYLQQGGNAMFYAEPGKQEMLNPILDQLGVHLDDGILVMPGAGRETQLFGLPLNYTGNTMSRSLVMQRYLKTGKDPAGAAFNGNATMSFSDTAGFRIEPILTVSDEPGVWLEKGIFVADSAAPVFNATEGDVLKKEYVLGVKLSRQINNKEQRIVVMGDADFMSARHGSGGKIGLALYSWLVNNEYPVYTNWIKSIDSKLTIGRSAGQAINIIYLYVIPGLLLLTGTVLLLRRRRK